MNVTRLDTRTPRQKALDDRLRRNVKLDRLRRRQNRQEIAFAWAALMFMAVIAWWLGWSV